MIITHNSFMQSEMKVVDVRLSLDNPVVDAKQFVSEHLSDLMGTSNIEDLESMIICGGITNSLIRICPKGDPRLNVMVRIFGAMTEQIIDRDTQEEAEPYLAAHGAGKAVYASFLNGQVEEWMNGRTLEPAEMIAPSMAEKIAKSVAHLHSVPLASFLVEPDNNGSRLWKTLFNWMGRCKDYKRTHADQRACLFDFDSLDTELKRLKARCDSFECPVVTSHMDLLSGNVLQKDNGDVVFIDFEYVCGAEFAYDIANHFNECVGFECNWQKMPTTSEKLHFIANYLKYLPDNHPAKTWTNERTLKAVEVFQVASHFFWGLWGIIQAYNSKIDFEYYPYAFKRLAAVYDKQFEF